jgi:hypothetical protein
MANIRYLKIVEKPPSDRDWLTLTKTPDGGFEISACVGHAKAATFGFGPPEPLRAALARAEGQAERLHIETIYVIGATDAERP